MKILSLVVLMAITTNLAGQDLNQKFVTADIDNFWSAYDKIIATSDSLEQHRQLRQLYLDKATPGLISMMRVRNYTERDFIEAIKKYPQFWASIRENTLGISSVLPDVEKDIEKLKAAYPSLKPATIYFVIGGFRSGGTVDGDRVLIGSELSLADENVHTDELPDRLQSFFRSNGNQKANLAFLCTHEYIHTQQKEIVHNLLSYCLNEGVAEFVSAKVTGKTSSLPAIAFGKANEEKVIHRFVQDMFIPERTSDWLWGENRNEFRIRDLGYYVGYAICERYYNAADDKSKAIKDLIELDLHDEQAVERIVDGSGLLPETLRKLNGDYQKMRPVVTGIKQFKNGSTQVQPGLTQMTVMFSHPLNRRNTGIDFGPLGEKFCPAISPQGRTWSDDGKSFTFEADLKPGQRYQILISDNFRMENGVRLKPYLIEITTKD